MQKPVRDVKNKTEKKPVIWMAGDSTMQSYPEEKRPQWGWGEKLLELLETEENEITISHRENSSFEQQKRYEGRRFIVDNCAMAGRSSKTFREEERLQDIEANIQPGDYLVIQFGHNDAGAGKPERYVPLDNFAESLQKYVDVAVEHGATPILISSIVLCPSKETEEGEAGAISRLLPEYGRAMQEYAGKMQINTSGSVGEIADAAEIPTKTIPYIDMNGLTRAYIKGMSQEEAEQLYMPDHVHLVEKGALVYAGLVVKDILRIILER